MLFLSSPCNGGGNVAASTAEDAQRQTYNSFHDYGKLQDCPVEILSAKIINRRFRNVRITFKNVSKQRVKIISIRVKGVNKFGEPAKIDIWGVYDDEPLLTGKRRTITWPVFGDDATAIAAYPYEVVLADGSKWVFKEIKN